MSHSLNIILASTSPRRSELLQQARVDFSVLAVAVDESVRPSESSVDYILRMAKDKADAALGVLNAGDLTDKATLVLTADTIGVLESGQVLTKPVGKVDAFAMWQLMSGNSHVVMTAVAARLVMAGQLIWQDEILEKTTVRFRALTADDMVYYWQTQEPIDKAGAYAIQGFGATWVAGIEGDYSNVVGLPLVATLGLIERGKSALMSHSFS
ncbi:MAG: Maf family protein [Moraxella sp.]|nr:Maf family protein [Moraxella sp.]